MLAHPHAARAHAEAEETWQLGSLGATWLLLLGDSLSNRTANKQLLL